MTTRSKTSTRQTPTALETTSPVQTSKPQTNGGSGGLLVLLGLLAGAAGLAMSSEQAPAYAEQWLRSYTFKDVNGLPLHVDLFRTGEYSFRAVLVIPHLQEQKEFEFTLQRTEERGLELSNKDGVLLMNLSSWQPLDNARASANFNSLVSGITDQLNPNATEEELCQLDDWLACELWNPAWGAYKSQCEPEGEVLQPVQTDFYKSVLATDRISMIGDTAYRTTAPPADFKHYETLFFRVDSAKPNSTRWTLPFNISVERDVSSEVNGQLHTLVMRGKNNTTGQLSEGKRFTVNNSSRAVQDLVARCLEDVGFVDRRITDELGTHVVNKILKAIRTKKVVPAVAVPSKFKITNRRYVSFDSKGISYDFQHDAHDLGHTTLGFAFLPNGNIVFRDTEFKPNELEKAINDFLVDCWTVQFKTSTVEKVGVLAKQLAAVVRADAVHLQVSKSTTWVTTVAGKQNNWFLCSHINGKHVDIQATKLANGTFQLSDKTEFKSLQELVEHCLKVEDIESPIARNFVLDVGVQHFENLESKVQAEAVPDVANDLKVINSGSGTLRFEVPGDSWNWNGSFINSEGNIKVGCTLDPLPQDYAGAIQAIEDHCNEISTKESYLYKHRKQLAPLMYRALLDSLNPSGIELKTISPMASSQPRYMFGYSKDGSYQSRIGFGLGDTRLASLNQFKVEMRNIYGSDSMLGFMEENAPWVYLDIHYHLGKLAAEQQVVN